MDEKNDLVTYMKAELEDGGGVREETLYFPKWQQPESPPTLEELVAKFRSVGGKAMGEEKGGKVIDFVSGSLDAKVVELQKLLPSS